jgi:hypothetical protein
MAVEAYEFLEGLESDSEAAEAARAPVRKPSSQPSFRPRPAPNAPQYVTQTQLEASLARVDGKVKTVADGVSTINAKIASIAGALKKEATDRKTTTEGQNKDLNQKLQMLALLPMLIQTPSIPAGTTIGTAGGNNVVTNTALSGPDPNQPMDSLLPLLLVSGLGGTGMGGLGGDSSGSDGGLMMLALVLALSNKS